MAAGARMPGDAEEPPFSKSTLVAFRKRLIEHEMDRRLVERTVEVAARRRSFGTRRSGRPWTLRPCGEREGWRTPTTSWDTP